MKFLSILCLTSITLTSHLYGNDITPISESCECEWYNDPHVIVMNQGYLDYISGVRQELLEIYFSDDLVIKNRIVDLILRLEDVSY